ncbi:trypsin-like [Ceratitis capitata]|uniref:trypsin-like n=1 Tax=Ceratitis capitata TaxID=7213 RepID=UPI000329D562|nr:trypsin-like [Ceratitis capitata]
MFRFWVLSALLNALAAATVPDIFGGRIVGGEETSIEAHPYQVSLWLIEEQQHFCGGSIISADFVLSAAHCLLGIEPNEILVRLGSTNSKSGGLLAEVTGIKTHAGFSARTAVNDIALLRLAQPVMQTDSIRYIELADTVPATGTRAVVSGWGIRCALCLLQPSTLQAVDVNIVQREDCASDTYKYGDQIMESMVCAYALKKDACDGDSGGPLVAESKLVGIVSWSKGCAKKDYPGVYASVPELREWITSAIEELSKNNEDEESFAFL